MADDVLVNKADAFDLLERSGLLAPALADRLKKILRRGRQA